MDLGTYTMKVVRHGVFEPEGKSPYVLMEFDYEGQECPVYVYISDAAVDMAYKRLKLAGFDIRSQSVYQLQSNRTLLAGNECLVKVYEETYKGKVRVKYEIVLEDVPLKKENAGKLDAMLLAVAEGSDEKKADKSKAPRAARSSTSTAGKLNAENAANVAAHADDPEEF